MNAWSAAAVAGLVVLHYLARKRGPATAAEIARSTGVSLVVVRRGLGALRRRGLVAFRRGAGFALARAAGEISVLEALGPRPSICVSDYGSCSVRGSCPFAPVCESLDDAARGALKAVTFDDLRPEPAGLPPCRAQPRLAGAGASCYPSRRACTSGE